MDPLGMKGVEPKLLVASLQRTIRSNNPSLATASGSESAWGRRHAVWVEGTAQPTWLQVFQLLDPAGDIGAELAMESRFGNPT
jgi:hypothetical protein